MKEIPVYLFVGFLEDGKTQFISETLSDPAFCAGERTLLILCEQGEIEYDTARFSGENVFIETIESKDELRGNKLAELEGKHSPSRILIEYNGMWELSDIYSQMPPHWFVFQNICIANSAKFPSYLANMRKLCYDKLMDADVVMFNRTCESTDKGMMHRTVRSVSRKAELIFEREDGSFDADEIVDELPFDKAGTAFSVEDDDFGLFYLDITEKPQDYEGKSVTLKAYVCRTDKVDEGSIVAGRFAMTCCVEDISFVGLVCEGEGAKALEHRTWVKVTADIELRRHDEIYGGIGPCLVNAKFSKASAPKTELVQFS